MLLYLFGSKDGLVRALLDLLATGDVERTTSAVRQQLADLPATTGGT